MIRNYILLFIRNLKRQKLFSAINLLGLTVSIASTLLIYLYVKHEFSFDNFHAHSDRLYRVNQTLIWSEDKSAQFSRTGPGVAHALKEELPEVELVTSLHTPGDFIISYVTPTNEVIAFEENKILAADTNFFKVLNFPLLKGDTATAFDQANTLVMTKSTAKKYFGEADPIGKMVRLGGLKGSTQQTYEVTGIMADKPGNSTMDFSILLSTKGFPLERMHWSWAWTQLETFVLLRENADVDHVRKKLVDIPRRRAAESIKAAMGMTYEEYVKSGKKWELFLQPINTLHLPETPVVGSFPDVGNIKIIYSLIGAAIFIVLLSCINFMNLSTAQFTRRIKEASIRKILGLGKKELSVSYFFEAMAFCMLALIAAVALSQLLLPGFNLITGKHLTLQLFSDRILIIGLVVQVVLMASISASYPALFLTAFHPVEAIKGKAKGGRHGKSFRNGLVIFQFSVSIILMICTGIVFQQLKYASEKDLGFNNENLIVLHHAEAVKNGERLASSVLALPGVSNASWCASVPPDVYDGDSFIAEGSSDLKINLNYTTADENYIPTLDAKILYGRNFQANTPADSNRVILNESAVQRIGWKLDESVIGKRVRYPNSGSDLVAYEVVGVVADFNYWTIAAAIEPMAIFHAKNRSVFSPRRNFVVMRIEPQNSESWEIMLSGLSKVWHQHAGDTPFQYSFIDENFAKTFATQKQFGKVLTVMATLAILIASLGLLGMIIYSLEQRTKEIGIRKVSGASAYNIVVLISKGYTKLIVIAFVVGSFFSYYMMNIWLQDFAYAVEPSAWIFILAGLGTLSFAILITSYHAIKAALTNPVDVLKDE